jgi:hypothetical protein
MLSSLTVQALTAYDLPYKASRDIRPVRYNIEKDHSEQRVLPAPSDKSMMSAEDLSQCDTT